MQVVQMIDALQAANKPFDTMMVPGRNHGLFGGKTQLIPNPLDLLWKNAS